MTGRDGTALRALAGILQAISVLSGAEYGPLPNRSVAHPFLLAACHSNFIGEQ